MTRIVGGIGIAHTPSMGYQYDKGMRQGFEPAWQRWYDGTAPVRAWLRERSPSHIVIIYNDHMNYFDLKTYPTFAIGMATGYGRSQGSTATLSSRGPSLARSCAKAST
jgi:protocatechuate 4,5-dioxygenase, beta chain